MHSCTGNLQAHTGLQAGSWSRGLGTTSLPGCGAEERGIQPLNTMPLEGRAPVGSSSPLPPELEHFTPLDTGALSHHFIRWFHLALPDTTLLPPPLPWYLEGQGGQEEGTEQVGVGPVC